MNEDCNKLITEELRLSKFKIIFPLLILMACYKNEINLKDGSDSLDNLLKKAMISISSDNKVGINNLLLSRKEHNEYFWKHVGERFTSDKGMTPDLAYDFMNMETQLTIDEMKKQYRNKDIVDIKVQCNKEPEFYGPFKLNLGCLVFLNESKDAIHNFYGIIEYKSTYKLYNMKRN